MSRDMTCRELVEFLMAYLDGELVEAERDAFDHHLSLCPPCRDYLDSYQESIRLGRQACRAEELDQPVPEELVQAILAARRKARGA